MEVDQSSEEFIDCADDVILYDKSLLDRFVEMSSILRNPDKVVPASGIKKEWSHYLEVAMEPAGWQAIWQISRCFCDKLGLRFPTKVMGTVEQVAFDEHTAMFEIEAVQDEIALPEKIEVPLGDLWPLRQQENGALQIDMTAKALDQFRFFYNHIWMPWDLNADDDIDWAARHLETRVKFYLALVANKMSPALVSYVRHLLTEAQYIEARKQMLEAELDDDEDTQEVKELMRLNFRMNRIANEIETIESPVLREYFEKIKFEKHSNGGETMKRFSLGLDKRPSVLAICPVRTLSKTVASFQAIECSLGAEADIGIKDSLQDLLDTCSAMDKVFLLPGKHGLTFSEYIFGRAEFLAVESGAVIAAKYSENVLFTMHGEFVFENLTFDCSNVRNGMIVKGGVTLFKKCTFIAGEGNQNGSMAVLISDGKVTFEDCTFHHFSTAVSVCPNGSVEIKSCTLESCSTGINVGMKAAISCDSVKFTSTYEVGIAIETLGDTEKVVKSPLNDELTQIKEVELKHLKFEGPNDIVIFYKAPVDVYEEIIQN